MENNQEGYVKETITFFRPSLAGRKYLNTKEFEFTGKGDVLIVEEKVIIKEEK